MNQSLTLALDWTPNINHIGFFVARYLGYYEEKGIDLLITDPRVDDYETTPVKKLELGLIDFALCPTESVISYRTKEKPFDLKAIAGLFKKDLSAIAVLADSGIQSPKELDNKRYCSYHARYEDGIVAEMIKNAGGKGKMKTISPDRLGIWENLLQGKADATWIFMNWEGVAASSKGLDLNCFRLSEYDIPYSYSPLIVTSHQMIKEKKALVCDFLEATKAGFMYCKTKPNEALDVLMSHIPNHEQEINLSEALKETIPYLGEEDNWGKIDLKVMKRFLDWLEAKGLATQTPSAEDMVFEDCVQ